MDLTVSNFYNMCNTILQNKICSKCKEEKPLSEYFNQKGAKTGKHSWCKVCYAKKRNKGRWVVQCDKNAQIRTCNKCKESKDILKFQFRADTGLYKGTCNDCLNKQSTIRKKERDPENSYHKEYNRRSSVKERHNLYSRKRYRETYYYSRMRMVLNNFLKRIGKKKTDIV